MKTRILILTILSVLILPELAPTAAQDSAWRVESIVSMSDVLDGFSSTPLQIYLAPDGHHVAYQMQDALCVFDTPTHQEQCIAFASELAYEFRVNDFLPALRWSPDSMKMALIGLPYQYFRDTDLGLVDLSGPEPTFANLADDGYVGNLRPGSIDPAVTLEVNPAFSPDSSQIAVERTTVTAQGQLAQSTLTIFDLKTGEVRDLSKLPGHEEYEVDAGSIIGMDWSPDGATLAVALRHTRSEPLYDGIWLVDVASGTWTRVVTLDAAQAALQTIYTDYSGFFAAAPVRWSPNGARLLFWVGDPGALANRPWVFWLDLDSGNITAIDLSATADDLPNMGVIWPAQAVWSPDDSQLLVAARIETPPDPADAVPLVETDEALATALYVIDVPSGARTLLGHLPLQVAPAYSAAWGPDGDVIAGGYSFKLVRE